MSARKFIVRFSIAAISLIGVAQLPALASGGGESGGNLTSLIPEPKKGGATCGYYDPCTGGSRVVVRAPNGATDIIDYGADGTILRQGRKPAAPPKAPRPPGPRPKFIGEKQLGNFTVQTWRLPNGDAYRVTVDASGREVGRTNFTGAGAVNVLDDAARANRPVTIIPSR